MFNYSRLAKIIQCVVTVLTAIISVMSDRTQRRDLASQLNDAIAQLKTLQAENSKLRQELYVDDLTGIANRRAFNERFPQLVELAHESKEPLALLIADVDGLKRTNDSLGHTAGDKLLKTIAVALAHTSRETDLAGRLGGDEFYVLLPGFCPLAGQPLDDLLEQTIQRYKTGLKSNIAKLNLPVDLYVNASFGIAVLGSGEKADDFYHRCDQIAQYNKRKFYEKLAQKGIAFGDERL